MCSQRRSDLLPSRSTSVRQQRSVSTEERSHSSREPYASYQSPANSSRVTSTHASTPISDTTFSQAFSQHQGHFLGEDFATQGSQSYADEQASSWSSQPAQPMTQVYSRQPFEAHPAHHTYYYNGSSHYYPQYQDVLPSTFEPRSNPIAAYKHHPTHDQQSPHEYGSAGGSHTDQSSYTSLQVEPKALFGFPLMCNSRAPLQEPLHYSQPPLYGPVYSIEDRQLPPLPLQPPVPQNPTFFHGVQALSTPRGDDQRYNDCQQRMTSSWSQTLPIRQLPYEVPIVDQPPRLPAFPLPISAPQSPEVDLRSVQSESPTATRRQSSRHGKRPQPVRSSSSSAIQHVCTEPDCPLLNKVFSTFGNLQRHRREKHSLDPQTYACPRGCGATFTRTTARENHLKNDRCKPPIIQGRRYDTGAGPSRRGGY